MTGRWPDPVRDDLPVGLITGRDIEYALRITDRHLLDPEDPAFDMVTFGAVCAARGALIECAETLRFNQIDRELHGDKGDHREWSRIASDEVARKIARKVINDLRRWLP